MTLEDIVERLFTDNPNLKEDDAVNKLKDMKDPKTNKTMWKAATIRNRVTTHLRKKGGEYSAPIESPAETKKSESNFKIEGEKIVRHRPKDPFAVKSEVPVEVEGDANQNISVKTEVDTDQLKKEIADDVSKKVLEQVSIDAKSFR